MLLIRLCEFHSGQTVLRSALRAVIDIASVTRVALDVIDDGQYRSPDEMVPVVITAADIPLGLSLARALRGLGVSIYGLALDKESPCCQSSAWTDVEPLADYSERGLLEALLKLSTRHPRQVLFAAQDDDLDIISRNREVLAEHYDFVLPEHPAVQLLADKSEFAQWAEENGFPVPRTRVVTSDEELGAALDDLNFPVVFKPAVRSQAWLAGGGRKKYYRLDSPEAAANLPFRPFDIADRYIVQEWIEGYDSDVYFCLVYRGRSGRELAYQTGRKLVQWPAGTGNTAICTSTEDPQLHRLTMRLFDEVKLVGLASVEVKRDRRDGKYYITEPTVGRAELQSNIATAAGPNLPVIAYHDARGVPTDVGLSRRRKAIWVNERELPSALAVAALRQQLNLIKLGQALFRCRAVTFVYGERRDMRPLLAGLGRRLSAPGKLLLKRRRAATPLH